jgi:hypothetical protein
VVYYFELVVKDICVDNTVSIPAANNLPNQIYYIDMLSAKAAANYMTIAPTFSQDVAIADCPLTCMLQKWDLGLEDWVDASVDAWVDSFVTADTGELTVWTDDTSYQPVTSTSAVFTVIDLKITCQDPFSLRTNNFAFDQFNLSIMRPCSFTTLL